MQARFAGTPIAWAGRERIWDCPEIPAGTVIDSDKRITLVNDSGPSQGGNRFRLKADAGEDRYVVARLGKGGPVLASAKIRGLNIYGASESGAFYAKTYDDGSRLVEMGVVQSRIFPEARVQLNIIVGGVMFDDGSLVKILEAKDFDETGLANVYFIMPSGIKTSNCHVMRAYENEIYLGEY